MIISAKGAAIMAYSNEFSKKMRKEGYESPFWRRQELFSRVCERDVEGPFGVKGTRIDTEKLHALEKEYEHKTINPNKKYISGDDWIEWRKLYTAEQIYKNMDWQTFEDYVRQEHLERLLKDHFPCKTAEGQCSLFCPVLGHCEEGE